MPSDFVSNNMGIEPVVGNTQQVEDSLYDRLNKIKPSTPEMLVPEQEASVNSTGGSLYEKLKKSKGTVSTEEEKKKQALVSEYFSYGGVRDDAKPNVIHIPLGQERKQSVSVDMDNGSVYLPSLAGKGIKREVFAPQGMSGVIASKSSGWVNEDEYGRTWTYDDRGNKIQLDANMFQSIDPSETSAYTQLKKGGPIKQSSFLGAGTNLTTEAISGLASGLSTVPSYLARKAQAVETLSPFKIAEKPSGVVSGPLQKASEYLGGAASAVESTQQVGSQKGLLGKVAGAAGTVAPGLMLGPASPLYFVPLMSESFRNETVNELKEKIKKDTGITDENSPEFQQVLNTPKNQAKVAGSEAIGTLLGIFPLFFKQGAATPTVWGRTGMIASEEGSKAAIKALVKSVPEILGSGAKAAAVMSLFRITQNAYVKGLINPDKPILEHVGDDALIGALFGIAEARGQKANTIYEQLRKAKEDALVFEKNNVEAVQRARAIERQRSETESIINRFEGEQLQERQSNFDSQVDWIIKRAKSEGVNTEEGFREWIKSKNINIPEDPQFAKEFQQALDIGIDLQFEKPSETSAIEPITQPPWVSTAEKPLGARPGETRKVTFGKNGVVRYMTDAEIKSYEDARISKIDKSINTIKQNNEIINESINRELTKEVTDASNKTLSDLQQKLKNNEKRIEGLEKSKENKPFTEEVIASDLPSVTIPETSRALESEAASLPKITTGSMEEIYGDLIPKQPTTEPTTSIAKNNIVKNFVARSREMTVSEIADEFIRGIKSDSIGKLYSGVDLTRAITAATRLGIKAIDAGVKNSAEFAEWAKENFPEELKSLTPKDLERAFATSSKFNPIQKETPKITMAEETMPVVNKIKALDPTGKDGTLEFYESMIGDTLNNIQANARLVNSDAMKMRELVPGEASRSRVAEVLDKSRQQTLSAKQEFLSDVESRDPKAKVRVDNGVDESGKRKYVQMTNEQLADKTRREISELQDRVSREEKLTDPNEIALANMYREKMSEIGQQAVDAGVLDGMLYDYVTHVVERSGIDKSQWAALKEKLFGKAQSIIGGASPTSRFSKSRKYETFAELESAIDESGLRVKTKDVAQIFKDYATSMKKAIEIKNLINKLKTVEPENGNPMIVEIGEKGYIPFGYEPINHPSFRGFAVASDLKLPLDFVFKARDMNYIANAFLAVTQAVKRSQVFGSLFHAHSLIESAIANINPRFMTDIKTLKTIKAEAIAKGLKEGTPEFDAEVNNLTNIARVQTSRQALSMIKEAVGKAEAGDKFDAWIRDGLMYETPEDVHRQSFLNITKGIDNFFEGSIEPSKREGRVEKYVGQPVDKSVGFFTDNMETFTWEYLQGGLKFLTAEELLNAFMLKNPNATPKEIAAQRKIIAQHVNTSFGGLNWFETARTARTKTGKKIAYSLYNPTARKYLQLLLFAPDWTISTLRNFKEAVTPHLPEISVGKEGKTVGMVKGSDGVFRPQTTMEFVKDYFKGGIDGLINPKTLSDHARRTQLRTAVVWATLYNAYNYAMTYDPNTKKGRFIWENDDPTVIDLPDGTTLQPAKHSMEGTHWLMHPGKTLKNKMALPGKLYEIITDDIFAKTLEEKIKKLGESVVPFTVRSFIDSENKWEGFKRALLSTLGFPIYGKSEKEKQLSKQRKAIEKQEERKKKAEETSKK